MSVKIRLKRIGAKARPYYRIVVMDSRNARDGRAIDEVGTYHPIEAEDKQISIKEDKINDWIAKGAQPTPIVKSIIKKARAKQA